MTVHWTAGDIGAAATAATAVGTGAWFTWRKIFRPVTRFASEFRDDWKGTIARPGVPARPGVMERLSAQDAALARIDRRVATVESQVKPNGGTSMHDAVSRIEQQISQAATAQPATVVNVHPGKES